MKVNSQSGISIIEMTVTMMVLGILMSIMTFNFVALFNPVRTGAEEFASHFKLIRSLAMSSTLAYQIYPTSNNQLAVKSAKTCGQPATNWQNDDALALDLPGGAQFTSTNWYVCVDARGLTDANLVVDIADTNNGTAQVEIFLGGGTKIA